MYSLAPNHQEKYREQIEKERGQQEGEKKNLDPLQTVHKLLSDLCRARCVDMIDNEEQEDEEMGDVLDDEETLGNGEEEEKDSNIFSIFSSFARDFATNDMTEEPDGDTSNEEEDEQFVDADIENVNRPDAWWTGNQYENIIAEAGQGGCYRLIGCSGRAGGGGGGPAGGPPAGGGGGGPAGGVGAASETPAAKRSVVIDQLI